jgi:N-acetylmuramoyl-L-alanine amidase
MHRHIPNHPPVVCRAVILAAVAACCLLAQPARAQAVRVAIGEGAYATITHGRRVDLHCEVPDNDAAAKAFLQQYLADPDDWTIYSAAPTVVIALPRLKPEVRREVLLALFPYDAVDERGWHHRVTYYGPEGMESLWAVTEWLTGQGTLFERVMEENGLETPGLALGQIILFPPDLLLPALRTPTPDRAAPDALEGILAADEADAAMPDLEALRRELTYGKDEDGPYAAYTLGPNEASLYTPVVVRFTDYREHADIMRACEIVAERSGIADVTDMARGTTVRIPLEMLSGRFRPSGSAEREDFVETLREAERLRQDRVASKDLEGVVVILDPGHGGRDHGASNAAYGLYEDELNYDIVVRIKALLESTTRARVYVTLRDKSQGFAATEATRFSHDRDEILLTDPPYENNEAKFSANLRWYLANSIYRQEVAAGTDPRKIIFTSIHCDALFNKRLRGAMVYIPGAARRRDREGGYSNQAYQRYAEVREQPYATSTASERRRDEALSRNFAETLLEELGKKRIQRHKEGDPIRNQIRQSGGVVYVPAVLRNTMVPTKVLVECANLTNETDCQRLREPWWRAWFAEAYVNALKAFYQ